METAAKAGAAPSSGMARLPIGSNGFVSPNTIVGKTSKPHFFAGSCPSNGLLRSDRSHATIGQDTPAADANRLVRERLALQAQPRRLISARTLEAAYFIRPV